MNLIIRSTLKTLEKSQSLLNNLSDEDLCNASISPYYSSVGTHIRHILDFYDCIFKINSERQIDLTIRNRNKEVESKCDCARDYLQLIIYKLNSSHFDMGEVVAVIDDLGLGKIEFQNTMGGLLSQANSHTIHHYAIINYILHGLNISLSDSDFGYNPSTPIVSNLN